MAKDVAKLSWVDGVHALPPLFDFEGVVGRAPRAGIEPPHRSKRLVQAGRRNVDPSEAFEGERKFFFIVIQSNTDIEADWTRERVTPYLR
jgi:hypothetical protein